MCCRSICLAPNRQLSWAALAVSACVALALPAAAAPTVYTLATAANPYGNSGALSFFSAATSVAGSFSYDPAAAATGTQGNGATLYNGSLTGLTGMVSGYGFSDPMGYTAVGNDIALSAGAAATDFLQLGAEPSLGNGTHNIAGFSVPGYTLVNVRMFWIEGQATAPGFTEPDFLTDQNLLAALPSFTGRLALDFVPSASPAGPVSWVFFDGLTVAAAAAVPEPPLAALWVGAAALLALRWRRRR